MQISVQIFCCIAFIFYIFILHFIFIVLFFHPFFAAPPGGSLASHSPAALTEPDSEIKIASVTTLGSREHRENSSPQMEEGQADINLMITSVTSLQEGGTSLEAVRLHQKVTKFFSIHALQCLDIRMYSQKLTLTIYSTQ